MNLLSVDTSTEACSAALLSGGDIIERYEVAPQQHAKLVLPMIDRLMSEAELVPAQLDAVIFGRGPGSFTGVRIATALAQGIAMSVDCPVVGVSSLAAIAQGIYRTTQQRHCLALIDARMNQVYKGAYTVADESTGESVMQLVGEEAVLDPQQVRLPTGTTAAHWIAAGSGFQAYHDVLSDLIEEGLSGHVETVYPSARDILLIGKPDFESGLGVDAALAKPVYLRDNVALTEAQRNARNA